MKPADQEYVDYVTARMVALRRTAYLLCGDEHTADDLVQQTITKLYEKWPRLRGVTHLDQYVRTMLLRLFIDDRRQAWARVRLFDSPPEAADPGVSGVEDRQLLRAALRKVPRRQQAVLVLRFLLDLPVDEVATLLDCSPGTVKSQTSHGLAALRRQLGEHALALLGKES